MAFKVAARTILHLGAELISSDGIAFYELIKNAFDARSKRVDIRLVVRLPHDVYIVNKTSAQDLLKQNLSKSALAKSISPIRDVLLDKVDKSAPNADKLIQLLQKYEFEDDTSLEKFIRLLDNANYIAIEDKGEGMSLDDLSATYLTIGTRRRFKQREKQLLKFRDEEEAIDQTLRPVLGENGVGRLSVMRLGSRLKVTTSRKGEKKYNILEIDWSRFSHESDELLGDIEVAPRLGDIKENVNDAGTQIRISGLISGWSEEKLKAIAREEFSKLTDPFVPEARYPISLRFNGNKIDIPPFNEILFQNAHAKVEAEFKFEDNKPILAGQIDYILRKRTFKEGSAELVSFAKVDNLDILRSLGPFRIVFYWYNRQILTAIEGIGALKDVRELLNLWAGGLMVYRDGFRVNPYGGPDDDWLSLDKKALAASGHKVNRRQIIGKIEITSIHNPKLLDQTNREGLRDCLEKEALRKILQYMLKEKFRGFLDLVDKEIRAREPVTFDDLEDRVEDHEKNINKSLKFLVQEYPAVKQSRIINDIEAAIEKLREVMDEAKKLAISYQEGRTQLVHLAGMGLMVEIIAHELNRATEHTLVTLSQSNKKAPAQVIESRLNTLESQLKTLQKRLSILDELSTTRRQRKELFDLIEWIRENLESHKEQFKRHHIQYRVKVKPEGKVKTFQIKAVKGMIVQILENLISNSVYWIKQQSKIDKSFFPVIEIIINTETNEVRFVDNGPGVEPERKEEIFEPFITSKPPGEGKGLGLFISREVAQYNDMKLFMSDESTVHSDRLNTFVLAIGAKEK